MKLYYSPGACSLSPHIVAHEAGIELALRKVDLDTKSFMQPGDYWAVNPKGTVPALELDRGDVLTECPVILEYLADHAPGTGLAPPRGTLARYRLEEALGYISCEIHRGYRPLFDPATPRE